MNLLDNDVLKLVFNKIEIKNSVRYIPFGDGEQNYTIFYKNYYPFNMVNCNWNNYFQPRKSKL